jgi:hypothetical protein
VDDARQPSHAAGGKRDLRFALRRGFAVFAMVVDHVGGALAGLGEGLFADAAWGNALIQIGGVLLVWCAIRARPGLAPSHKGLESVWAGSPSATGADTARLIVPGTVSLDARIAQAQAAGRDGDFLR